MKSYQIKSEDKEEFVDVTLVSEDEQNLAAHKENLQQIHQIYNTSNKFTTDPLNLQQIHKIYNKSLSITSDLKDQNFNSLLKTQQD